MKPTQTKLILTFFGIAFLITIALAQTSTRSVLGKNDYSALFEAAPSLPASPAEAGKRAYGADMTTQNGQVELDVFYAPYNQRVAAARAVIKDAVANHEHDSEALGQRSIAQANASPLINRMGGVEKMSQMSEEELKQAAAQAVGSYTQSLSGAPSNAPGGGMQALTQRLMSDPAYQARFEKMSKAEQEAEVQKYMGNAHAPAPPTGETAAERQAKKAVAESQAVLARQKELGALMQRLEDINVEFAKKDEVILTAPGGYDEIAKDVRARMAKVPLITGGELTIPDPAKMQPLEREYVTRHRTRANWELQQRILLYNQTKGRYKEVAIAYSTWIRNSLGGVSSQNAQLLDDATVILAVKCEERLIETSERLAKYSSDATGRAAGYELSYQRKMSEPLVKPLPLVK